jgi:hypothetical protein
MPWNTPTPSLFGAIVAAVPPFMFPILRPPLPSGMASRVITSLAESFQMRSPNSFLSPGASSNVFVAPTPNSRRSVNVSSIPNAAYRRPETSKSFRKPFSDTLF